MCVQTVRVVTAGDLIRHALAEGETQRGLARRLAASGEHAEIERWRFVVIRAANGGEPEPAQASRVGELFGVELETPLPPVRPQQLEGDVRLLLRSTGGGVADLVEGQADVLSRLARIEAALDELLEPPESERRRTRH